MIRTRHALMALILLPSVAVAQRGRDRGTKADYGAMERESAPPMKLTKGDLEDLSPLKVLVDKRKDLKLTDDQQKQLKEMQGKLKESTAALMSKFDSLRIVLRPRPSPSDEDQIRMTIGREELSTVLTAIRSSYDASVAPAVALLDEAQKATAAKLLDDLAKETEETIREKSGVRSGAGGGGRGRGGRP